MVRRAPLVVLGVLALAACGSGGAASTGASGSGGATTSDHPSTGGAASGSTSTGGGSTPAEAGATSIPCGTVTCGAGEYCLMQCPCIDGGDCEDGTCLPIPTDCTGGTVDCACIPPCPSATQTCNASPGDNWVTCAGC